MRSPFENCATARIPEVQQESYAIFIAHMKAELASDLDDTLATIAPNPHLVNVPTMMGGQGPRGVRTF
jgi:carboxymethylenebutenolidase